MEFQSPLINPENFSCGFGGCGLFAGTVARATSVTQKISQHCQKQRKSPTNCFGQVVACEWRISSPLKTPFSRLDSTLSIRCCWIVRLTLTLLTKATTKHTNINPKHTQRRQYKHDKQKTAISPQGNGPPTKNLRAKWWG